MAATKLSLRSPYFFSSTILSHNRIFNKPSLFKFHVLSLFSTSNSSSQTLAYAPCLLKGANTIQNGTNQFQSSITVSDKHLKGQGDDEGVKKRLMKRVLLEFTMWRRLECGRRIVLCLRKAEGDGELLSPVLYREKLVKTFDSRGFVNFRNLAKMSRPDKKKVKRSGSGEGDKNKPKIQTVVMELEVLAGNHSLVTTVAENGLHFQIDWANVYWSSKLATERQRLLSSDVEREEESKRLRLQKVTEEAEQKRLATEYEQRKKQRILKEIGEHELADARALLEEAEKRSKKKGKKPIIEGDVTKETLVELVRKEREEKEKKMEKVAKTMDYLERAKREEAAPLIEAAFQQRIVEERVLHERMQQQINEILANRKKERDIKRKTLYYLKLEEERQNKLREEEEVRKREEAERKKKEEAERMAKLNEIAEKQRQREREVEEKERLRREAALGRIAEPPRSSEPPAVTLPPDHGSPDPAGPAPAPTPGKYVPRWKREKTEGGSQAPPPQPERWTSGSSTRPEPRSLAGSSTRPEPTDRWNAGGGPKFTWSSSRKP